MSAGTWSAAMACPPSPPIETGIKARRVHRDGGTRECSRYFGRGRSSTAAQGTRSVVRGPSFCWCMRRGHVLVCLESGDWRGGMKGEFLHPSLTATNDVPPQPCIKKAQPIEGRDTHSLRGVERSIGHVVEGTLEEEETSRSTLQCPSIRHHHHHQAALQLQTARGLRCVGTDQDHHLVHLHPQSTSYTLSHDTAAWPSHCIGTEADKKKEGNGVPSSNVHRHRQRQRQRQQLGNQSTGGGHPFHPFHPSHVAQGTVTSRPPPLQLG